LWIVFERVLRLSDLFFFRQICYFGNIVQSEILLLSLFFYERVMAILELEQIEKLTNFEAWWDRLLSGSLDNNPFVTYDWMASWWKHFGKGRELKFFTAESLGSVSLIIPVMYSKYEVFGLKRRKATFACAPDSDYQVFLATDFQRAAKDLDQLVESIMEDSNPDCIVFQDVPEGSITARLLENIKQDDFIVSSRIINSCPYIPLSSTYESYFQSLSRLMRRNLRVCERDAMRDFKVDFLKYDHLETMEEAMTILFELHQKRQVDVGNFGVFSNDIERNFHVDLAKAFAEKGWLALFFLTFDDKTVSSVYCFEYNGKLYVYLSGFDPMYAKYRPGYLIYKDIIKYAFRRNLKEVDFLRGDEEYKSRWGTQVRKNLEFRIEKRNLRGRFYNWTANSKSFSYLYRGLPKDFSQNFKRL